MPIVNPKERRLPEDGPGRRWPGANAFEVFAADVRGPLEAHLEGWLEARVDAARARGPQVLIVAQALRDLVLRGGKRLRAALLAAAYVACGGEGGALAMTPAGAALELLQAYLLVHDDWMDGDAERRGGPSVPAVLRERLGGFADAASVLAGDLACGWAQMALFEVSFPADRVRRAAKELARVQEEVVSGQVLDVACAAADAREVEAVHALKTASYSVRGPVVMGAALAGADERILSSMAAFGDPLGVAFQLRDDLLGTFGDPRSTGKPVGSDLRKGKRTSLLVDARRDPRAAALVERAARGNATDADVGAAVEVIAASGARGRVEERIAVLAADALKALEGAEGVGKELLASAIVSLTERER
jgi:geranylgeranyl diphosphate synthase type I